jgi:hypothetical protein
LRKLKFSKDQQIVIGGRFLAIKSLHQATQVFKLPVRSYDDYKTGHATFMHMIEDEEMHAGLIVKTRNWGEVLKAKNKGCWDLLRKEVPFLFE